MPFRDSASHFIVGIAGGTGSGKTTLAQYLAQRWSKLGSLVVDQDSYYMSQERLSPEEREAVNYDSPSTIDHDLLLDHFNLLLKGETVKKPCYSFVTHTRTVKAEELSPEPLIILEGLFALWDPRLRALMGLKIFAAADPDVRLIRRLRRDLSERGRTAESVLKQYLDSVRPMHEQYVEPQKAHADVVVNTTRTPLEECLAEIDRALATIFGELHGVPGD